MPTSAPSPAGWRRLATPSRLVRSGLALGAAIAVANGLSAVTQLVLAHRLSPPEYSLLVTLFVVITIAGVPLSALQATVTRGVAEDFSQRGAAGAGAALLGSSRELSRLVLPVCAGLAALAVPAAILLNVQHVVPIAATAVTVAASAALTLVWAGLQGTQSFGVLSLGQVGFAIAKLGLAVGAAWAGAGVGGVMAAIAAATVVTLLLGSGPLLPYLRAAASVPVARRPLLTQYSRAAVAALTVFAILTSLDVLTARVMLPPGTAGRYAATSVAARALLLIPTAITMVLFPHVSTLRDARSERRHLLAALATTVAAALIPVALLFFAARPIMGDLFGSSYRAAAPWVGPLAVAMALYGVAFVFLFHSLAIGRTGFWRVGAAVLAIQVAGFALFHSTPTDLVGVQIVAAATLALSGEIFDRRGR